MRLFKRFFADLFANLQSWIIGKWKQWNYIMAVREANQMAAQYHRKYYVIQSSEVHWRVFSTADVRHLKRTRVFKKDLTFKEMTEKSAYVAYPKNY